MGISSGNPVKEEIIFNEPQPEDLKDIVRIEKASFPDPWTPSQLLFEIINEYSCGFVARNDERVVGYIFAMIVREMGYIGNLAVDPEHRRKGIGGKLLNRMLEKMKEKGVEEVFLEVRPSNKIALKLYETRGFERIGIRKRYYRNGEDAILMKKVLKDERKGSVQ